MGLDEQIVQTFPRRCPYCDQPVSYDLFELKPGENLIVCPSCHKTFVRVLPETVVDQHGDKPSTLHRKSVRGKRGRS